MAKHLTQAQRYYICLQLASYVKQCNIAKVLGVSRSTASREINRNGRGDNDYDSDYAHKKASIRKSQASQKKSFKSIAKY